MLQNAIKLGVNIALGTDQFPFEPNGGTTATVAEAELYVKAGMTPLQALQSATTQCAKMMGVEADLGRLQAGKYADVVAVEADPTKDISALRTVDFVMESRMDLPRYAIAVPFPATALFRRLKAENRILPQRSSRWPIGSRESSSCRIS